jgi:hypothetical protein
MVTGNQNSEFYKKSQRLICFNHFFHDFPAFVLKLRKFFLNNNTQGFKGIFSF